MLHFYAPFPGYFALDGLYSYAGSDAPDQTEDGRPGENTFEKNRFEDTVYGTKIREMDNTVFIGA